MSRGGPFKSKNIQVNVIFSENLHESLECAITREKKTLPLINMRTIALWPETKYKSTQHFVFINSNAKDLKSFVAYLMNITCHQSKLIQQISVSAKDEKNHKSGQWI